jgi:hypothetical protein
MNLIGVPPLRSVRNGVFLSGTGVAGSGATSASKGAERRPAALGTHPAQWDCIQWARCLLGRALTLDALRRVHPNSNDSV